MDSKTSQDRGVIVDDGARHAETVAHKERMPNFDKNGLRSCNGVTFSAEQKRWALNLIRPV